MAIYQRVVIFETNVSVAYLARDGEIRCNFHSHLTQDGYELWNYSGGFTGMTFNRTCLGAAYAPKFFRN